MAIGQVLFHRFYCKKSFACFNVKVHPSSYLSFSSLLKISFESFILCCFGFLKKLGNSPPLDQTFGFLRGLWFLGLYKQKVIRWRFNYLTPAPNKNRIEMLIVKYKKWYTIFSQQMHFNFITQNILSWYEDSIEKHLLQIIILL